MNNDNMAHDIVGTGFQFPMGLDGRGGIAMARQEGIDESIRIILSTPQGERRMRPAFGSRIHELVFAPNNASTWALMQQYVKEALDWWEPRIEVLNIDASPDASDASKLLVNILYRVEATSDERNLVYPFYLSG
jgi:hypothetical protein